MFCLSYDIKITLKSLGMKTLEFYHILGKVIMGVIS